MDASASASSSSSSSECETINNEDGYTDEESDIDIPSIDWDMDGFNAEYAEEESGIDLIKAARNGNTQIFDEPNLTLEHYSVKCFEKNNFLHIAARHNQIEFLRSLLWKKRYLAMNIKKLISERNSHGNTPFHFASQAYSQLVTELLYWLYENDMKKKKKRVEGGHEEEEEKPWMAQNSDGNTALHLALLCNNIENAMTLLSSTMDCGFAGIVNNSKEAPLHLVITHVHDTPDSADNYCETMTRVLLERSQCVATWRDAKGLTPLLRAAFLRDPSVMVEVTKMIIHFCPESTLLCDAFGKSFLHHLIHSNKIFDHLHRKNLFERFEYDYKNIEDLICLNEISVLKDHQDQDGNTPLHIALKCENIHMARSLLSKCNANPDIRNKDGISARSMAEKLNVWHQLREPKAMTKEECSSANKGDINFLVANERTSGPEYGAFYAAQDDYGSNFLHLLLNKAAEHHYLSSDDGCSKFFSFISEALFCFPELVCQTDQKGNTPLHILAQNKDFCKTLADKTALSESRSLLSKLLSMCDDAIIEVKTRRTTTNESDNHDQLPWVMQNAEGTPLHEAIIANNKVLVLELLSYSEESARLVNKNKDTPLHLLAATSMGMEEFTVEDIMKIMNANIEALGMLDKDGIIPILRAVKVANLQMVVSLLHNVQKFSDTDGQKFWHLIQNHPSKNFINGLLQDEAFRNMLQHKDKKGNTPLHLALKEKCFGFVENILETGEGEGEGEGESSERNQLASNQWLMDLIKILDNDGLTPIIGALKVDNLKLATRLCHVNPQAAKIGDFDGKTIWHFLPKHPSYNSGTVNDILQIETLRKLLEQKDRDGNTSLHLAIKGNCFDFVQYLLETSGWERESSNGNQWPMNLFIIPNNVGETPEDLLADLPTISKELEKKLLTDRRTRGIRSSWRIPRTQLQNYMSSMNVIAALQTTITFTAAFTVPGGLIQDTGSPILIQSIAFQIFMISDVIAMCLSMMVLIFLLWMVATDKRESVMIQDFAVTLLLISFVATLMTFMAGVFATIFPVKPWIAIATLVLCSFLMLLIHRLMVTKLLLPFINATSNFVQMFFGPGARLFSKTIKKLKSDKSDTHLDDSDTSPYERNIV